MLLIYTERIFCSLKGCLSSSLLEPVKKISYFEHIGTSNEKKEFQSVNIRGSYLKIQNVTIKIGLIMLRAYPCFNIDMDSSLALECVLGCIWCSVSNFVEVRTTLSLSTNLNQWRCCQTKWCLFWLSSPLMLYRTTSHVIAHLL